MKKFFMAVILTVFSIVLLGCPGEIPEPDPIPEVTTYTVTYASEHGTVPAAIKVEENTLLLEKDLPALTAQGFDFKGWFDGEVQAIAGSYKVIKDVTLTAKWENVPSQEPPAQEPPAEEPPSEEPPAEEPPVENPPAEEPPVEDPPAENPPAEDPPASNPPWGTNPPVINFPPLTNVDNLPEPDTKDFPFVTGKKYQSLVTDYCKVDGGTLNKDNYSLYKFEFKENNIVLFTETSKDGKEIVDQYEYKYSPKADENAFYVIPNRILAALDLESAYNETPELATYEQVSNSQAGYSDEEAMKQAILGNELGKAIYQMNVLSEEYLFLMKDHPELAEYFDKSTMTFKDSMPDDLKALVEAVELKIVSMSDDELWQYILALTIKEYYMESFNVDEFPDNIPLNFATYQKLLFEPGVKEAYNEFNTIRVFKYEKNEDVYKSDDDRTNGGEPGGYKIYEVVPDFVDTMEEIVAGNYRFVSKSTKGDLLCRIYEGKFTFYDDDNKKHNFTIDSVSENTLNIITGEKISYSVSGCGMNMTATVTYNGVSYTLSKDENSISDFESLTYFEDSTN